MTQWKDVLELGSHLIRELKLDQRDTIDRWMACHLAELMDASKSGKTEAEREEARKVAVETILKIWERRSSVPGNAYPLARYKDILQIIDRLQSDYISFKHLLEDTDVKKGDLVASIQDELLRLFLTLLLIRLPRGYEPEKVDSVAINSLSEVEQKIFVHLQRWSESIKSDSNTPGSKSEEDNELSDQNLDRLSLRQIDTITEKFKQLRWELEQDSRSDIYRPASE